MRNYFQWAFGLVIIRPSNSSLSTNFKIFTREYNECVQSLSVSKKNAQITYTFGYKIFPIAIWRSMCCIAYNILSSIRILGGDFPMIWYVEEKLSSCVVFSLLPFANLLIFFFIRALSNCFLVENLRTFFLLFLFGGVVIYFMCISSLQPKD